MIVASVHNFLRDLHHPIFDFVASATVLWLLWYIWTFRIYPYVYPQEPLIYPYWVPFIGHLRNFIQDADFLVSKAKTHFGNNGELFSLHVAGKKLHIITSVKGTTEFYKNKPALDFTAFQLDTLKQFGMSNAGCKLMSKPINGHTNGRNRINLDLIVNMHHSYLRSQTSMDQLVKPIVENISSLLHPGTLPQECINLSRTANDGNVISLYALSREVILRANVIGFWGSNLLDVAPNLISITSTLDTRFHNLLLRMPRILDPEVFQLRDEALASFDRYMDIPIQFRTKASPVILQLETISRELGLCQSDISAYHLAWLLASNNNIHAATFWVLSHLSDSPELASKIRDETTHLVHSDFCDVHIIGDRFPYLTSLWQEVLRFYGGPHTSGRHVQEDTVFGGKRISRGATLLVATSSLHRDKAVWGPDAAEFVADRFIKAPHLATGASYRPFGGGVSLCSGSKLAFVEMITMVACILNRFHIRNVPGEPTAFPRPLKAAPLLGTMHVIGGDDRLVVLEETT
jgi:hypothetical protein